MEITAVVVWQARDSAKQGEPSLQTDREAVACDMRVELQERLNIADLEALEA